MKKEKNVAIWAVVLNSLLFVLKIIVGILSNSLALIADAFNSLTDIITSIVIFIAVNLSGKKADASHPFGYHRVQPLAAFIVAVFAAILGFEIIKAAVENFFTPKVAIITTITILVPIITIVVKAGMAFYYLKYDNRSNSPAIKAIGIDARNDVFVAFTVLIAIIGAIFNILYLDSIVAIFISSFIFYSAYQLAVENINYLIGKAPPKQEIDEIKAVVSRVNGVKGINDVKAHYVGHFIHIEIHIEVDGTLSTENSHQICIDVREHIESIPGVDKAFVHIDPR